MTLKQKKSRWIGTLSKLTCAGLGFLLGWLLMDIITGLSGLYEVDDNARYLPVVVSAVFFALVGFFTSKPINKLFNSIYKALEKSISGYSPREIFMGAVGFLLGLGATVGIYILFVAAYIKTTSIALVITVITGCVLCFFGSLLGVRVLSREQSCDQKCTMRVTDNPQFILHESALDSNLLVLIDAGFISGRLAITKQLFDRIKDDSEKNRLVASISVAPTVTLEVVDKEVLGDTQNQRLLKLAENSAIICADEELIALAKQHGVKTLNLHSLKQALKD